MSIYDVRIDGSIDESRNTEGVLKSADAVSNQLKGRARILDHYDSDLKLTTFGDLPYGAIFFHLIENEAVSDLVSIEGGTTGE